MAVIVDLALPSQQFELGRILEMEGDTSVVLETMVPMGERTVPFFRVHGEENGFEESVRGQAAVSGIEIVSTHDGEVLYALDWDISDDTFFEGLIKTEANLLKARGVAETWSFELRFPTHEALSVFQGHCTDHDIPIDVKRLYNPTKPGAGPWYGLTAPQRFTLARAVETGFYSIPRQTSTQELATEFGITDQAVTERLRRAIRNLVTSTLLLTEREEEPQRLKIQ
ncbi:MAG: helix-turn-helix domain-containing protein [Halobacteriales archaeon]|nr:helix-turn-helix domain-containing protein [Halobacteriales archaeon]